ncbi:hypothetical protein [Helicobacter pylori]|uniref:hypothetical protein n=1 Tax=Helicobacter pylori TaxID=210 RepID=UPI0006815B94|nr:hypothetical protein [Helicobacter pylori]KNE05302.1 hypothetical protein ACM23_04395 [Helicobacter pylori]KNE05896.1 hypothetical protein ACM23_03285 [Helicobacter pylori]
MKNLLSFELFSFEPFFFGGFDEKSFLVFFITNDKRACQKQAIILKMKKSFLAFLVLFSRKLDATLNDSF